MEISKAYWSESLGEQRIQYALRAQWLYFQLYFWRTRNYGELLLPSVYKKFLAFFKYEVLNQQQDDDIYLIIAT